MRTVALLLLIWVCGWANAGTVNSVKENSVEGNEEVAVYCLKGLIYDAQDEEGLSGATLMIGGKKYYTDFSGNFTIPELPKGKHKVTVDFISYCTRTVEIDILDDQEIRIDIRQR